MKDNRQRNSNAHSSQKHIEESGGKENQNTLIQPELFPDALFCESTKPGGNSNGTLSDNEEKELSNLGNELENSKVDLSENEESELSIHDNDPENFKVDHNEDSATVMTITHENHKSIGQTLSQTRTQLELTIEDVVNETHIRNDYILSLEADDFQKLPSATIYTKSYIRSLCRLYNLNSETLISKYEQIIESTQAKNSQDNPTVSSSSTIKQSEEDDESTKRKPLSLTLSWIIAIIISLIALIMIIYTIIDKKIINNSIKPTAEKNKSLISDGELEQFIMPEQLPLRELSLPEEKAKEDAN